jgi:putative transposase
VQLACRVLNVPESGYYAWRKRPPSARALRHAWLTGLIRQIHTDFRGVYGARRVHAELTLGHGIAVGRHAVEALMRPRDAPGLIGTTRASAHPNMPTAADLVDRQFQRSGPDRLGVTDITEHLTLSSSCGNSILATTSARWQDTKAESRWY